MFAVEIGDGPQRRGFARARCSLDNGDPAPGCGNRPDRRDLFFAQWITRANRLQHRCVERGIPPIVIAPEDSIAELCRREGIAESLYYSCSKEFLEAGKKRLSGDTARQASSGEVKDLRRKMHDLKEALAEQVLENRLFKKSMIEGEV